MTEEKKEPYKGKVVKALPDSVVGKYIVGTESIAGKGYRAGTESIASRGDGKPVRKFIRPRPV